MSNGFFAIPLPKNEPVLSYAPGSKERVALKKALEEARSKVIDIPMYIGAEEVRSENKKPLSPPRNHSIKSMTGRNHQSPWQEIFCETVRNE